jgi:flagellar motor switch protein FliM
MSDSAGGLLRRMVRPSGGGPGAVTPMRALRIAAARAADRSAGLPLSVLGIAEEEGPLDALLATLPDEALLLRTDRAGAPSGLLALDPEARSAVIEARILGAPAPRSADPRAPTATDAALCMPFAAAFLIESGGALAGSPLEGWIAGAAPAGRFASLREAEGALPDGPCRVLRLTLDLGGEGRQGLLALLLRSPAPVRAAEAAAPGATLAPRVLEAEVPLTAILHRVTLPLHAVEGWQPGQILPLPGVSTATVRVEAAGGVAVGAARLGQLGGRRAIRLEAAVAPALSDLPPALPGGTAP